MLYRLIKIYIFHSAWQITRICLLCLSVHLVLQVEDYREEKIMYYVVTGFLELVHRSV